MVRPRSHARHLLSPEPAGNPTNSVWTADQRKPDEQSDDADREHDDRVVRAIIGEAKEVSPSSSEEEGNQTNDSENPPHGVQRPNDPSSATRRTGRNDCNRDALAGFAAAHG